MDLTKHQIDGSLAVWNAYIKSGERIVNAGQVYSNTELDNQRLEGKPPGSGLNCKDCELNLFGI